MPEVTCVIPTHGRPHFLREALESVLAQTEQPERIVVVNDAPDAATADLVADVAASSPVPVVYLERTEGTQGASESRNHGAAVAETEYIAFLDDDDVWHPDYLARALELAEPGDLDAVVTAFYRFAGDERLAMSVPADALTAEKAFATGAAVTGSTLLVKRASFTDLGGYDPQLPVMNDVDLFIRFLLNHRRYAVVRDALVGVRKHGNGQLSDNSASRVRGGWIFVEKYAPVFSARALRARRFTLYRIQWRIAQQPLSGKLHALAGMLRNWRKT